MFFFESSTYWPVVNEHDHPFPHCTVSQHIDSFDSKQKEAHTPYRQFPPILSIHLNCGTIEPRTEGLISNCVSRHSCMAVPVRKALLRKSKNVIPRSPSEEVSKVLIVALDWAIKDNLIPG